MKITFLTDNYVDTPSLKAEHGFSCLIEFEQYRILFDTGQTDTMVHNMKVIFGDLPKLDGLVLSHGHYDHTGGLSNNFEDIMSMTKRVFCHEYIFENHLKQNNGQHEYIGMTVDLSLGSGCFEFIQNNKFVNIFDHVYLSGSIKRSISFNADEQLYAEVDGKCIKDPFRDEQYMIIEDNGLVIITGCSHSGIINIIKHAKTLFPHRHIRAVVGGFHLFRCNQKQMDETVNFLKNENIDTIITGHCTGLSGLFALKEMMGNKIIPIKVGLEILL